MAGPRWKVPRRGNGGLDECDGDGKEKVEKLKVYVGA